MSADELASNGLSLYRIEGDRWHAAFSAAQQSEATDAVEAGGLILFPRLAFPLSNSERLCLAPDCVEPGSKNVSFDPRTGVVRGATTEPERARSLRDLLARYAQQSSSLVRSLFAHYVPSLEIARTSFRPFEASDRTTSWRKDDRRLHVDAFPSSPNQGRRLLRVFSNVNPEGRERIWNIGEPFEAVARRFLPSIARPWPGEARLLHAFGVTRGLRTEYDQIMLRMHDQMKGDDDYQANTASTQLIFPSGSTWITQTDAVSHAVLSGQFMFEQTFLLPVDSMVNPGRSPLRILERLSGRRLT